MKVNVGVAVYSQLFFHWALYGAVNLTPFLLTPPGLPNAREEPPPPFAR